MSEPRRLVVTGATGNVGTAVLRAVAAQHPEWQVVGVCRRPPAPAAPPYDRVQWVGADVGAESSSAPLAAAMRGADVVVHLAWLIQPARDERLLERVNVEGTRRVAQAAAAAGVAHLVHFSSVGAYSAGPKNARVDESWPTAGVPSSQYSRHKAAAERVLDEVTAHHPDMTVTRVRPGLVFQREAASEITRYFIGPLAPTRLVGARKIPVLPFPPELVFQVVHAADVADAVVRIVERRAGGAYNVAGEPVIRPEMLAGALGGRYQPVPFRGLRAAAAAAYRAGLTPTEPGWLDLARDAPVMSTDRARADLDWTPTVDAVAALDELLAGMGEGAGAPSPTLYGRESLGRRARRMLSWGRPGAPSRRRTGPPT